MKGVTHVSLVIAKTKLAPIKSITILQLVLCRALIMAHLLKHVSNIFYILAEINFPWIDSRVGWLRGDLRHFRHLWEMVYQKS